MAKKNMSWSRALGDAMSMATSFAAAVGLGWWVGSKLDIYFHTAPYLMLVMLLVGVATGLKIIYDLAFGKKGFKHLPETDDEEEGRKRYGPSKEAIDAINEAKKMLAGLETEKTKPVEEEQQDE